MPELKKFLDNFHCPNWLLILVAVVIILRIPSFFMPYSYGDESIYLTLGQGLRQGVPLYSQLYDNKPPLLYLTAAIAGSLFWFKAILAFWSLATVILFWKLTNILYPKKDKLQIAATAVFAVLTTIPLFEGNIVNAELFMIGPIIGGFIILLGKKLPPKNLVMAGSLFSVATLFKVPAAFDMMAIIALWTITTTSLKKNWPKVFSNTFYLVIGFITPIALSLLYFAVRGAFSEYLIAAFLQNVGYLSSWRPADAQLSFFARNQPLLLRTLIVAAGVVILWFKQKSFGKQFSFITLWLLMALFGVTLSERPYPHYFIQAVPAVSLLFGLLFTSQTKKQSYAVVLLALAFLVPYYFHFWHYSTTSYYRRFINLATGRISKSAYITSFSGQAIRNYEIASLITRMTQPTERIFVWGDDAKIYALSRRLPPVKYVADYHINDFGNQHEIASTLAQNLPSIVVILPEGKPFPELHELVEDKYLKLADIDNAEIWKVTNKVSPTLLNLSF